ncbi:hypothetical protein [Halothiobacillus sp.]|uniref:hypothetical protein n=1 Tax=Halothiobacillus sp. TaxID=1891311 RepID=UPI00261D34BB|nr:hypothetical protein [Halothiobacillus sp.]
MACGVLTRLYEVAVVVRIIGNIRREKDAAAVDNDEQNVHRFAIVIGKGERRVDVVLAGVFAFRLSWEWAYVRHDVKSTSLPGSW